jgi:hypothetical protein
MNNSIEISQSNNRYVQQFNRAVLYYEMFLFKERQQKKTGVTNYQRKSKMSRTEHG